MKIFSFVSFFYIINCCCKLVRNRISKYTYFATNSKAKMKFTLYGSRSILS